MKKQKLLKTDTCPECGSPLIHTEGCIKCVACDWGVCGN